MDSVCLVDRYNPCGHYEETDNGAYCHWNECLCSEVIDKAKCSWDPDLADRLIFD